MHGRLFPNGINELHFQTRVSDPKVAEATVSDDKQHLRIQAKSPGSTLVLLYLNGSSHVYDVIDLEVGSLLSPSSPVHLHVGGSVRFESSRNTRGDWVSEDPALIHIDGSGVAHALQRGSTYVELREAVTHRAKVVIWQADTIEMVKGPPGTLTNYKEAAGYLQAFLFQFKAFDSRTLRKVTNFTASQNIDNSLVFRCEVEEVNSFVAESRLDKRDGEEVPLCTVTPREHGNSRRLSLVASISSRDESFKLSKRFEFPFDWQNEGASFKKVELSRESQQELRL